MAQTHKYKATITWTGNKGSGTMDYRSYDRDYAIKIEGKEVLYGSSDSDFLGDKSKYNPEDLLLAALSSCHMLWYLHLCSKNNIIVIDYTDTAHGSMVEHLDGSGKFTEVTLHPIVTIANKQNLVLAEQLHKEANRMCFIANSVNFPVRHLPVIRADG